MRGASGSTGDPESTPTLGGPAGLGLELGLLLRLGHQRASRAFAAALQPLDLDGRLFGVLSSVGRAGPTSQAALAATLDQDKSAIMRSVDDLQRRGLVERQADPADRRTNLVALTDAGTLRLRQALELAHDVAETVFADLGARERETLRDLLSTVARRGTGTRP